MFTIGDFAAHGRVSVRMLRHYDAIGLLRPAHVDPTTGYRHYRAEQLAQLNRLIALKGLGFSLEQVRSILHDSIDAEQLRGMLRLRRAELEAVLAQAAARLAAVEARLRTIESENSMPTDVVVKSLPAVRIATVSGPAASFDPAELGPVAAALYARLRDRLDAAGEVAIGPGVTRYEDVPDSGGVVVHAGLPVAADVVEVTGALVVDIAGVERAATVVHRGSLDRVLPTVQALARWLEANGFRMTAEHAREISVERPSDRHEWITELQVPITLRS